MFANAQRLSAVAIANGGSGYVVGDIVSVDGSGALPSGVTQINGIRLWPERRSKLQVTSVGAGGTVTALNILNYGAWETSPSPASGFYPCGGSGTGLQLNLTFTLYWQNVAWIVPNSSGLQSMMSLLVLKPLSVLLGGLATITMVNSGGNYVVGDVLTVAGGTLLSGATAATISVDEVNSSGSIVAAHILTWGGWSVLPTASPNTPTGGSGSGALFNLTFNAPINSADKAIAMAVEKIRGAIQIGQRIPISLTAGAIPPEAESHCYTLALQMLIMAIPTLAGYATRPPQTGGKAPFEQLVFDAKEYITNLRNGKSCEYPSDPDPNFHGGVQEGAFTEPVDLQSWGQGEYPHANDNIGILT